MKKILYTEAGPNNTPYKKGEWKDFVIHNQQEIKGFFGEYRFMSNFWPAKVFLDNVEYTSTELAYQAAKWKNEDREYFQSCTDLESIEYNRNNKPNAYTEDVWDVEKNKVMFDLLKQKFDKDLNPENYEKLKETDGKYLEEMNWWGDLYWGKDIDGQGQNILGLMLMKIRDEMK